MSTIKGATPQLSVTPEAVEVIERLRDKHGELAFFQAGCGDGSSPTCMTRGEFLETDADLKLGAIAGAPFLVDKEQYERWNEPEFVLDVAPGAATSLSLEGGEDVHFVARIP